MTKFFLSIIVVISALNIVAINTPKVFAVEAFPACTSSTPGDEQDSAVCRTPRDTNLTQATRDLINLVANFIAAVGGIIAVVMIVYNGLQIIMSSGDSAKVVQARTSILYLLAGIVVIVLARTIVYFIMSRI